MDFEKRESEFWPDLEMRATRDGLVVEGYAMPFDSASRPIPGGPGGSFREMFRPGAFNDNLKRNPDVLMKYQHNNLALPTGRTRAGTLALSADTKGLIYRNTLPDNEMGRPIFDAIERRDITGTSISFRVRGAKNEQWSDNGARREVFVAELGSEISYVDHPAYPDTTAFVRGLAEAAGVDVDELSRLFDLLQDPAGRLSTTDRELLNHALDQRTDVPPAPPEAIKLAAARERLAARVTAA